MHTFAKLMCGAVLLAPFPVWAQEGNDAEDEILVTALRRETRAQDTPLAVTAISGKTLAQAGVTDLTSMPPVPGLSFVDSGPSNTRFVIRGVQAVGEPTVGVYYDEVSVTGAVGPQNDAGGTAPRLKLFDVERVEVLRGPQGTLFGSGSMGGTVQVIFSKPVDWPEAAAEARIGWTRDGGFDREGSAMLNLPVAPGLLAVRAVAYDARRSGYIDSTVLNLENFNDEHVYGGRLLARLTPAPRLTIDGAIHYQLSTGDKPIWHLEAGPYKSVSQVRLPNRDENAVYSLTARWEGKGFTATATGSISHRDFDQGLGDPSYFFQGLIGDAATCTRLRGGGSPCTPAVQATFNDYIRDYVYGVVVALQESTTHSGEVRIASTSPGWLQWTVGGFYSDRDAHNDNNQLKTDAVTGAIITPYIRQTERLIDDKLTQYAGFGEVAVTPLSWLTATAGLRYFDYRRQVAGNTAIPLDLINARLSTYTTVASSDKGWVFKGNLAVRPSDNLLVYGQAAQGFRPGGVNQVLGLPASLAPYRSDSLWTYELGLKSSWADRRVTFNLAFYHTDWSDMQVTGQTTSGPFSFISNAGAARIKGIEAEATIRPLFGLEIQATAAYTDAELSEDQHNTQIIANGLRGDRIPYVPRFAAGGAIAYNWHATDGINARVRLDVSHVSASTSELRPTSPFYRRMPGYNLVNLHAGAELRGGWLVEIFANNLFDEVAILTESATGLTGGKTLMTSARPRTIGLSLGKRL